LLYPKNYDNRIYSEGKLEPRQSEVDSWQEPISGDRRWVDSVLDVLIGVIGGPLRTSLGAPASGLLCA